MSLGVIRDDFDAFVADLPAVYEFEWAGHVFTVRDVDIESFDRMAKQSDAIIGRGLGAMIAELKAVVAAQLSPEDAELWNATRPPYQMLAKIVQRIMEAVSGRPTSGLSISGEQSAETGQPSNPSSSAVGTLPPPSAG